MIPEIKAFFDRRIHTLSYLVHDSETRDAVVIDPVLDYEPVSSSTFTESVDAVSAFIWRGSSDYGIRYLRAAARLPEAGRRAR
jgi:hypothetical protein